MIFAARQKKRAVGIIQSITRINKMYKDVPVPVVRERST